MRSQVLIHWGISSFYGWGVYGLNLALNWSLDPDLEPVCSLPLRLSEISLDPLKKNILNHFFSESASFESRLKDHLKLNSEARIDVPLLVGLGNDFNRSTTACGKSIHGTPTIGITFFEDPNISPDAIDRAREFGSSLFPVEPGGLDGHRMMPADDTRGDVWTVVGAWQSLACG